MSPLDDSNRTPVNRRLLKRLFSKIKISTEHFHNGYPCWDWTAGTTNDGYGSSNIGHKFYRAPRLIYQIFVEIIPKPLVLDHLCRRPICVNPTHLDMVTQRENTIRGKNFIAENVTKLVCPQGHPLIGANLVKRRQRRSHHRECRECARMLKRNRRRKLRGCGQHYT